ncbi:MAG: alpha-amylase family glycosyl hydrolase [Bacteroidota bacterium]|nr:alpha-amylase family glycosyl hydrolase [Bacteroidota bacterium]
MQRTKLFFVIVFIFSFTQSIISQPVSYVKHPDWSYNKTIYEVNIRQYTKEGTFKAFEEYLPQLKEMGVGILWIMPINPIGEKNRKGPLGSSYSVKDYLAVNPEFGTLDDFKHLVKRTHELGMYLIIDWVANHTAWDNKLITEHPEWYTKDNDGNFVAPIKDWTDVVDLNYDNKDLRAYMQNALIYWVKECDIDGFRCDVADMVPTDFWNTVRPELEKIKPVFMLAEAEKAELQEYAFDMTYSWEIFKIADKVAQGKMETDDIKYFFKKENEAFPANVFRMRFTSNHDENSWNGTEYERLGDAVEPFTVFNFVINGMPLIYSGQEAGNHKRLKFFEKDPIDWKESKCRNLYTDLCKLKLVNPALWSGDKGGPLTELPNSGTGIFSFSRVKGDNKVICLFNFNAKEMKFLIETNGLEGVYKDYFSGQKVTIEKEYSLSLPKWGYKILVKE